MDRGQATVSFKVTKIEACSRDSQSRDWKGQVIFIPTSFVEKKNSISEKEYNQVLANIVQIIRDDSLITAYSSDSKKCMFVWGDCIEKCTPSSSETQSLLNTKTQSKRSNSKKKPIITIASDE